MVSGVQDLPHHPIVSEQRPVLNAVQKVTKQPRLCGSWCQCYDVLTLGRQISEQHLWTSPLDETLHWQQSRPLLEMWLTLYMLYLSSIA